jgi:hypothetical protein
MKIYTKVLGSVEKLTSNMMMNTVGYIIKTVGNFRSLEVQQIRDNSDNRENLFGGTEETTSASRLESRRAWRSILCDNLLCDILWKGEKRVSSYPFARVEQTKSTSRRMSKDGSLVILNSSASNLLPLFADARIWIAMTDNVK